MRLYQTITITGLTCVLIGATGCLNIKGTALRTAADILSEPGSSNIFISDDDPELVRDALPFGLKVYEMLLTSAPDHRGIHITTASSFISYANAFLAWDAVELQDQDFERAEALNARAVKLYLRGRDYALAGLAIDYPAFEARLRKDPTAMLKEMNKRDVPALYWLAAGWGLAISAEAGNMDLVADLPLVEAIARRALELDETFDQGALHGFLLTFEASRGAAMGGSKERAQKHFDRVVELTKGQSAMPYVSYASLICVREQDVKTYKEMLQRALAIDVQANKTLRLLNIIAQEQAQWYLDHGPDLFLDFDEEPTDAE